MGMRIWVDDLRDPPKGYSAWAKDSKHAIGMLRTAQIARVELDAISLDHDLGGEDTTRPVVMFMIEHNIWPKVVLCHSSNPPGVEWIEGMIERYKP